MTALCCLLKALYGLLEIENGLICTEKTSFKVGDVPCRVAFCVFILSNLPLEGADGLGRAEIGLIILLQLLF